MFLKSDLFFPWLPGDKKLDRNRSFWYRDCCTGIKGVDSFLRSLYLGDTLFIVGDEGSGKTALCVRMGLVSSRKSMKTLFCSSSKDGWQRFGKAGMREQDLKNLLVVNHRWNNMKHSPACDYGDRVFFTQHWYRTAKFIPDLLIYDGLSLSLCPVKTTKFICSFQVLARKLSCVAVLTLYNGMLLNEMLNKQSYVIKLKSSVTNGLSVEQLRSRFCVYGGFTVPMVDGVI